MKPLLLIHYDKVPIPHYRIQNYRYLRSYLAAHGFDLTVCADGDLTETPDIRRKVRPGFGAVIRGVRQTNPLASILVVNHSQWFFFPLVLYLKARGIRVITWTHGTNLQHPSRLGTAIHHAEHELCDGIVLYADHMRRYLLDRHREKSFVAPNTLDLGGYSPDDVDRTAVLDKYGISTRKNIIFVGRIQARKRVTDLLEAFRQLTLADCGLILVGPDDEGLLRSQGIRDPRVFVVGELYGRDVLDLLSSADVSCIPGAVGLSVVDAMYCGLPVVTEDVVHGPEITYLHDGENGFVVPKGDVNALASRLNDLLTDHQLRRRFSDRARQEMHDRARIEHLCDGVRQCVDHVLGSRRPLATRP